MSPTPSKTPASLIEDGYSIDLVPWWKYLWQRFNPWHPSPKEGMRWIPINPIEESSCVATVDPAVAVLYKDGSVAVSTYNEMRLCIRRSKEITHYCPLPPLP